MVVFNSGDVPRVDGRLAVARAFGDRSLKRHLSSDPDVVEALVDLETEFLILASDGLWKVNPCLISSTTHFLMLPISYFLILMVMHHFS